MDRLLFLTDGVYAIALTLLAVELGLSDSAADLQGLALLRSIVDTWPKMLAFLTSFTVIANFWVGHMFIFQHVRRFDGGLMWLVLLQLLCIAFIPFPTSVVGEHFGDPVAQELYFGTLFLTGLVMAALWWYVTSGRRLVHSDLSLRIIRRTHIISFTVPAIFLLLMVLVAVGVGRLVNPLLLGYLMAFCFMVFAIFEGREPSPEAPEGARPEDSNRADG